MDLADSRFHPLNGDSHSGQVDPVAWAQQVAERHALLLSGATLAAVKRRLKAMVWIVRPAGRGREVLLLQRPDRRGGGWHPVTGKADAGEAPHLCAGREAFEETGLRGDLRELGLSHTYEHRRHAFEEHAFVLRVPAGAEPRLSDEHVAHWWASPEDAHKAIEWSAHREALDLALKAD